jgi:uncharacterized protein (TIGR00251 family)
MPSAVIKVQVTPRASKNCILKILDDGTVKIHITAPPVEGKANTALKKFLAKILDISISRIDILVGESGRYKTISVMNMDAAILKNKILEHID